MRIEVDADRAKLESLGAGTLARVVTLPSSSTQQSADAREELTQLERFHQIVVRARLEAEDAIVR